MRKRTAFKALLRSPMAAMLTFLFIAAASFALFSRVTDYAVTTREAANAESLYNGVAALDNTVPNMVLTEGEKDGMVVASVYHGEDKPWPTEGEIEKFSSLPGVTLADTRYMTAGLVEDFKRLVDREKGSASKWGAFVLEGNYCGWEEDPAAAGSMQLLFDDITVLAGDIEAVSENTAKIVADAREDFVTMDNPYPKAFFEKLEKGSRCLVVGEYNDETGSGLEMGTGDLSTYEKSFQVIDGVADNYLETEDFHFYKEEIETINQNLSIYDMVYTSDMRAIPRFNEGNMAIGQGRLLTEGDQNACVVSESFLETHQLSIGDRISVKLGDKLCSQNFFRGAQARNLEEIPNFGNAKELEIIGAYRYLDDYETRRSEYIWSYSPSAIFVPASLLPVDVPAGHEISAGEFSVFVEDAHDIGAFKEAAEPLAAELGLGLHFSDGGWLSVEGSFEAGALTSFLTTVFYIMGAALALFLAVALFISRSKKTYAVMRTLGVPGKKARNAVALPFAALSVSAMLVGGTAGLVYASGTAAKALKDMAASAPEGYVPNAALPIHVIILCLLGELILTFCVTLLFLRKMQSTPPLELLQEGVRMKAGSGAVWAGAGATEQARNLPGINMAKLFAADEIKMPSGKLYNPVRHVAAYILRHMRRGMGKTVASLLLSVVLAAGVGLFVLSRLTYQDAFSKFEVKGRALEFSSSSIAELSDSDLIKDFYCYNHFYVRLNGEDFRAQMTITNDMERYLASDQKITYAKGYDLSVLEKSGAVCLMGQEMAEGLGIHAGGQISLLSDTMYSALKEKYGKGDELLAAVEREAALYKVIGIIESQDPNISAGIFTGVNEAAERVYGQPYPVGYSEFKLSDNARFDELNRLLESQKKEGARYAPMAAFYLDMAGLKNIQRIRGLMESLFPIAIAAALMIGIFGSGLVIMQSAQEAAFLRILGVTKKRARCMLVFEQVFLCIAGIAFVAAGAALYSPGMFARSADTLAACWLLYLAGCICGAFAAAMQVTRLRALELLQRQCR